MRLEVLVSAVNIGKKDLKAMNTSSDVIVVNQCQKNSSEVWENFKIFSYNERGTARSRNRGLSKCTGDIVLLCDDDVVYDGEYEKNILAEFKKHPEADIIVFNTKSPNRKTKDNKNWHRIRFYNVQRYASTRVAFRRRKLADIKFNEMFGPGAKYEHGEDTIFLVDALKAGKKLYASPINIATVSHSKSSWFHGYNKKYFFDKGALFTEINCGFRYFLILQYLVRHREVWGKMGFIESYKTMKNGAKDYKGTLK